MRCSRAAAPTARKLSWASETASRRRSPTWVCQVPPPGSVLPSYLSSTAPTSAKNDDCWATISTGGGTTSLTLGSTCPTTVSGATVYHSDTAAFNACLNNTYGNCRVPCPVGAYMIDAALVITQPNTAIYGDGRCSQINWYGPQNLFNAAGTAQGSGTTTYVSGTMIRDLYINGKAYASLGKAFDLAFMTQFGMNNIRNDDGFDGFACFDCNINTIIDLTFNNMTSEYLSCFHNYSDGNGGSGFDLQRGACGVLGGNSYYIKTQYPFWIDGAISGGNTSDI